MAKVVLAFHSDPKKVGSTVDLPDDEAKALVNEGRARYAETKTTKKSESKRGEQGVS